MTRFIQIHTLTSYPAALLNRDDAGFAKRIPYGEAVRTRISSQCLKRHWRRHHGPASLDALEMPMSIRSRYTLEEKLVEPLAEETGDKTLAHAVVAWLSGQVFGESQKAKAEKAKKAEDGDEVEALKTGQITVLGEPEVAYLLDRARAICAAKPDVKKIEKSAKDVLGKEGLGNLKTLALGAGLDAALFGRMVTSDALARCDAAVHVAHAFTVHREQREDDYFTAVGELAMDRANDFGAGHVGSTELTSGLYYGYVCVDVPLLISNLTGGTNDDRNLASRVVDRLIRLVATVSPGAKVGSTAPHSLAEAVVVEAGAGQPCTLASAFLRPVPLKGDVVAATYRELAQKVGDLDWNYPSNAPQRAHLACGDAERYAALTGAGEDRQPALGERKNLDDLAAWAADQVAEATACAS